jgi:hypothetical protein
LQDPRCSLPRPTRTSQRPPARKAAAGNPNIRIMSPPSFSFEESASKNQPREVSVCRMFECNQFFSDCAWPMIYYILQIRLLEANALSGVLEATPPHTQKHLSGQNHCRCHHLSWAARFNLAGWSMPPMKDNDLRPSSLRS